MRRMITSITSRLHAADMWNPIVMEIGPRMQPTFGGTTVLLVKDLYHLDATLWCGDA